MAGSNAPERYLTWRWEDEENAERLVFKEDTKMPNAGRQSKLKE